MHVILLLIAAVSANERQSAVDFDNEIIPVLTKAGCNTGACHGAAAGRGGLKLSLYGGDPDLDYRSIALELEGRRVNLARPAQSLVLLKATESIVHGGGYRLEFDGPGAELLKQWVADGTQRLRKRKLSRVHVSPTTYVVEDMDAALQLKATAEFTDGSQVDVTRWTVFTPEDSGAVEVDSETAMAKLLRRGRNIVVARYLDQVVPIEIIAPLSQTAVDLSKQPRQNFVDDHVLELLKTLRLRVSPQADDNTFLRRATLDLTGRLPTVERIRAFQSSIHPQKREQLIDELLGSEEFSEYWTMRLSRLLRVRSQAQDNTGAMVYHQWLKQQVVDATPYDEFARAILTALGNTHEIGPANFYRTVNGAREQAEFASELFMGSRLRCANCHNHPLDRWTQDDYHGLAAVFAKIERGVVIKVSTRGEVTHPRTGEAAIPRIPGEDFINNAQDGRAALAGWLTGRDNPYFARAIVNRLWRVMMGRGLVEPTDDFRATNPATHPALLDQLADDFRQHGYDLRHTLRRIANSAAYARSAQSLPENRADDRFYSRAIPRPLEPEVLADAISDVLGVADTYGDQPLGTRAVALFDGKISSEALNVLGRCSREDSCEASSEPAGGLPLKLHLFNGALLNGRLSDPSGRLAKMMADGRKPDGIIDEFYLSALGRQPSPAENEFWNQQMSVADAERPKILEDFLWSLLSCREFAANH